MTKLRKKKKRTKNLYWTEETEQAIIQYNESDDDLFKEKLFRDELYAALDKLSENIINRFKFPYMDETFEDVKAETVSYLVLKLNNFKPDKGKSFGYFSTVAKNYLILQNNKKYKELNRTVYLSDPTSDENYSLQELLIVAPEDIHHVPMRVEFVKLFIEYWDFNLDKIFHKKRDLEIAYAIIELMRRSHMIENFNKKALYLMIREITDCQTSYITRGVKQLKTIMDRQYVEYKNTGNFTDYFDQ